MSAGQLAVVCTTIGPSVLHNKNFNIKHNAQTFQPNSVISAMLIGTIDLFLMTLTLMGITRSAQSKTPWPHFLRGGGHTFQLITNKFGMVQKQFRLNILILVWSDIYGSKGKACHFTDCVNKL